MRRAYESTTPYDERLVEIDERICQLISERQALGGENPGIPESEKLNEWQAKYGVDRDKLYRVFSAFQVNPLSRPLEPSNLRTVIPVVKKVKLEHVQFQVSYFLQYENCSVVYVDLEATDRSRQLVPHAQFTLRVLRGEETVYQTNNRGSKGSGQHAHMEFTVVPALPDDVHDIRFEMVPVKRPVEQEIEYIELTETILFE